MRANEIVDMEYIVKVEDMAAQLRIDFPNDDELLIKIIANLLKADAHSTEAIRQIVKDNGKKEEPEEEPRVYIVRRSERYECIIEVEALSPEDAIERVKAGWGDEIGSEYVETLEDSYEAHVFPEEN